MPSTGFVTGRCYTRIRKATRGFNYPNILEEHLYSEINFKTSDANIWAARSLVVKADIGLKIKLPSFYANSDDEL
jgi:hypothetical protein